MMNELSILELQDKMNSGIYTARVITEMYLERIKKLDKQGPKLNSIIELNPEALAIATALDAERRAMGPRGPLHGIPVVIKDNIDTSDQMTTTAGSIALIGSIPLQDAFIVQMLREAGAIILGKTTKNFGHLLIERSADKKSVELIGLIGDLNIFKTIWVKNLADIPGFT